MELAPEEHPIPVDPSLRALRHERDLAAALRVDGPWTRPEDGGVLHRLMAYLVDAHQADPPRVSDRAFRTLPQAVEFAGSGAGDEDDVRSALTELESLRLVESVGARRGEARWRATDHGVCSMGRHAA